MGVYSQYRGFIIDPAPARHPEAKGCVENQVKYVRQNFFAGETFTDRDHAQSAAQTWCRTTAGLRLHGTTRKRPLLVFEEEEQPLLLPLSCERFDVPVWATCSVHRDHHVRFKNALYSVPTRYVGKEVEVKGTRALVRIYYQQSLIKTHPKVAKGKKSTDFDGYPKEKSAYAMRDVEYYIRTAKSRGESQGAFMEQLLSGDVPRAFRLISPTLLVIDDFGLEKLSPEQAHDFYEIVAERYERSSTIITSNRHITEWVNLFDDTILANSALDRLAHNAHQMVVEGESYRKKKAAKRTVI